ncbi:hypothetical protein [Sinorhizobium americanum]|uniref:Uncharacterized protein n=1 Tax=Sinorhizobium americanum TaxID=194963 RepID=A0A1L3LNV4_9HYPH|nr:hypothetical protein [Sinorhizobium americanum]APG85126.1 hypothetical protein SAMCCGM7_Ch2385 [Sinorhizobium americanum CCGM7]APG91771.1 hypothetical protein SAMCFNEI73_Ch2493 [Sinorhizobium americanum]OAP47522.1 hypothetical protein ATC00_23005 [Sinorhizobium americanum]TCN29852.1 hypothetical protein EV184_109158 [Sinorhizobium americanum]
MDPFNSFRDYPILPGHVAILEGVLHRALEERNVSIGSEEADELARKIVKLYQTGVKDGDQLWEMIRTV